MVLDVVEPFANDKLEDNLNPLGRVFYSVSSIVCVPAYFSENGPALGTQAGKQRIAEITKSAGFSIFRRAKRTPLTWCLRRSLEISFR